MARTLLKIILIPVFTLLSGGWGAAAAGFSVTVPTIEIRNLPHQDYQFITAFYVISQAPAFSTDWLTQFTIKKIKSRQTQNLSQTSVSFSGRTLHKEGFEKLASHVVIVTHNSPSRLWENPNPDNLTVDENGDEIDLNPSQGEWSRVQYAALPIEDLASQRAVIDWSILDKRTKILPAH